MKRKRSLDERDLSVSTFSISLIVSPEATSNQETIKHLRLLSKTSLYKKFELESEVSTFRRKRE